MSESTNPPTMTFDSVKSGLAIIDIGKNVSLRLVGDRRCFVKVTKQEKVVLTPTSDVVDLQIIPEDKALQICCILGYSDEEMMSLLKRRSELAVADKTAVSLKADPSS